MNSLVRKPHNCSVLGSLCTINRRLWLKLYCSMAALQAGKCVTSGMGRHTDGNTIIWIKFDTGTCQTVPPLLSPSLWMTITVSVQSVGKVQGQYQYSKQLYNCLSVCLCIRLRCNSFLHLQHVQWNVNEQNI